MILKGSTEKEEEAEGQRHANAWPISTAVGLALVTLCNVRSLSQIKRESEEERKKKGRLCLCHKGGLGSRLSE